MIAWAQLATAWLAQQPARLKSGQILGIGLPAALTAEIKRQSGPSLVETDIQPLRNGTFQDERFDLIIIADRSPPAADIAVLLDCFKALVPGGAVLLRPADADDAERKLGQVQEFSFGEIRLFAGDTSAGGPVELILSAVKIGSAAEKKWREEAEPHEMRLYCDAKLRPTIRPAPLQRDWMDGTPEGFAYRCLPMSIANCHAWEVLCPTGFSAEWSGSADQASLSVSVDDPATKFVPLSHFGSGILTMHIRGLVRTPPGVDLFVTGPMNQFKRGIHPLTAIIETDWTDLSFTMNWKVSEPDLPIRFEEGEPFCAFFPLPRGFAEGMNPRFVDWRDAPGQKLSHRAQILSRRNFGEDQDVPESFAAETGWQKTYFQGKGAPAKAGHRPKLRLKPFRAD